jgi:hypothetical protein
MSKLALWFPLAAVIAALAPAHAAPYPTHNVEVIVA